MKFIKITIVVIFFGCGNKIIKSDEYRLASKGLSYHEKKENLKLISEKELKKHKAFIFFKDTIPTFPDKGTKVFGIRNISNGLIYIFQFNQSGLYRRIECDSMWSVNSINILGDVD